MQLSAANLLIASQQITRGVQQPALDAKAKFDAALKNEKSLQGVPAFEPLEFVQAPAKAAATAGGGAIERPAASAREAPASNGGRPSRPGANLDIRV